MPPPGQPELPDGGYPPSCPFGYTFLEPSGGEAVRRDWRPITEAELKAATDAGVAIRRVVVVEIPSTGALIAHVRLSDRDGWHELALRRKEASKAWRDYRTLRAALGERGYRGPIFIYPVGHPLLARLGVGAAEG